MKKGRGFRWHSTNKEKKSIKFAYFKSLTAMQIFIFKWARFKYQIFFCFHRWMWRQSAPSDWNKSRANFMQIIAGSTFDLIYFFFLIFKRKFFRRPRLVAAPGPFNLGPLPVGHPTHPPVRPPLATCCCCWPPKHWKKCHKISLLPFKTKSQRQIVSESPRWDLHINDMQMSQVTKKKKISTKFLNFQTSCLRHNVKRINRPICKWGRICKWGADLSVFVEASVGRVLRQEVKFETGQRWRLLSGHGRRPVRMVRMMIGGRLESFLPHQLQFGDADNVLVRPHFDEEKIAKCQNPRPAVGGCQLEGFVESVGAVRSGRSSDPFEFGATFPLEFHRWRRRRRRQICHAAIGQTRPATSGHQRRRRHLAAVDANSNFSLFFFPPLKQPDFDHGLLAETTKSKHTRRIFATIFNISLGGSTFTCFSLGPRRFAKWTPLFPPKKIKRRNFLAILNWIFTFV